MEDRLHQYTTSLIVRLLHERTGQTISEDRRYRVDRAIETVLADRGIPKSTDLIALLTQPDSEAIERDLVEALLNNETYFFRDRQAFGQLAEFALPRLFRAKATSRQLTIWSAGCSTGQEPLSLAMLLLEQNALWQGWTIRIVATDVSLSAIDTARRATYSQFEIQRGLAVGQMLDFFEETAAGWRACERLTGMVCYETGNLIARPPASGPFDLVLCRNVLLYFDTAARHLAWTSLARSMAPHGLLMLGGGETNSGDGGLFEPAELKGAFLRRTSRAVPQAAIAA
jgi:chemotaxis protein methyltransferase CheR